MGYRLWKRFGNNIKECNFQKAIKIATSFGETDMMNIKRGQQRLDNIAFVLDFTNNNTIYNQELLTVTNQ